LSKLNPFIKASIWVTEACLCFSETHWYTCAPCSWEQQVQSYSLRAKGVGGSSWPSDYIYQQAWVSTSDCC
jgi:hypothetical protein